MSENEKSPALHLVSEGESKPVEVVHPDAKMLHMHVPISEGGSTAKVPVAQPVFNPAANIAAAEDGVRSILRLIGEDETRNGLLDTPARVVRAWGELTSGYEKDPAVILERVFTQDDDAIAYGGMIMLRDIEMTSLCEHHMLPFSGTATVVYIPGDDKNIVGISKLARLVDCFARRLQVQERLTAQIADAIETHLKPKGVMVIIEASHLCMRIRGVQKQQSVMTTSEVRGVFKNDQKVKEEALSLARGGK
jgi:GTP cyclohydrolase I